MVIVLCGFSSHVLHAPHFAALVHGFRLTMPFFPSVHKCQCHLAVNGQEAVDHFRRFGRQYSCIFMDINMPGMSGVATTKLLRAIERDRGMDPTPIVAVTAQSGIGERDEYVALGMTDLLPKPVKVDQLKALLRQLNKRR